MIYEPDSLESPVTPPPMRQRAARRDGWTEARRRAFLDALGQCGSLDEAAKSVAISRMSVWRLRRRDPAFDQACRDRQWEAVDVLRDMAYERALLHTEKPVYDAVGKQVGTKIIYNDKMIRYLLSRYDFVDRGRPTHNTAASGARTASHERATEKTLSDTQKSLLALCAENYRDDARQAMDFIAEKMEAHEIDDLFDDDGDASDNAEVVADAASAVSVSEPQDGPLAALTDGDARPGQMTAAASLDPAHPAAQTPATNPADPTAQKVTTSSNLSSGKKDSWADGEERSASSGSGAALHRPPERVDDHRPERSGDLNPHLAPFAGGDVVQRPFPDLPAHEP